MSIPRAQLNAHLVREEALAPARSSLAPWKIRCVQAFVAANLHSAIRVIDIAKAANCGRTQLKRVFEESFGYTPYQYVIRRRVARAKNLMLLSNDSLCDIATECGFASASALSRRFRQIVGESPRAWRRVHEAVIYDQEMHRLHDGVGRSLSISSRAADSRHLNTLFATGRIGRSSP